MKKTLLALIAIAGLTAVSAQADQSRVEKPLYQCALTFQAQGGGFQVFVGSFKMTGVGKIRCMDIAGNQQEMDVKVTMGASHFAANVGLGKMQFAGLATGIGVANGPESLLGTYIVAHAEGAVAIGAGANLSIHGGAEALTMNLGVNVVKGWGAQVGINKMKLEALN